MTLECNLRAGIVMPPLQQEILLFDQGSSGFLCFHVSFKVAHSISVKNITQTVMSKVLNLTIFFNNKLWK